MSEPVADPLRNRLNSEMEPTASWETTRCPSPSLPMQFSRSWRRHLPLQPAALSQAATIAALQDGKSIAWIDTDQKKVTGSVKLDRGASLIGFDAPVRRQALRRHPRWQHRHHRGQDRQMAKEKPADRSPAEGRDLLGRFQSGGRSHAHSVEHRHEPSRQRRGRQGDRRRR